MAHELYRACTGACNDCATACSPCAVVCLQEHDSQSMTRCTALGMDCAPTCHLAAPVQGANEIAVLQAGA